MLAEYAKLAIGILASFLMAVFFLASEWDTIKEYSEENKDKEEGHEPSRTSANDK